MSLALNHAKEIGKKEAWDFLMSHHRFLLVGHEHPDGDDVGSCCRTRCPMCIVLSRQAPWCIRKCRRERIMTPWCLRIWEIWNAAEILISLMWTASASTIIGPTSITPTISTFSTNMPPRRKCWRKCSSMPVFPWTRTPAMPCTWL